MNLAQAVLLITYEFYQATLSDADLDKIKMRKAPAPKAELENFIKRLEADLDNTDFFSNADQKSHSVRNLRNLFDKGELTSQEIQTLFGVFKAIKK